MSEERPILFSGPMVRAILEGRKTQTRRMLTPQPWKTNWIPDGYKAPPWQWHKRHENNVPSYTWHDDQQAVLGPCPYGSHEDRLWVREKFGAFKLCSQECSPADATYVVLEDGTHVHRDGSIYPGLSEYSDDAFWFKWRPSIHMPRWASRITLEVTGVRVERLQDISEQDSIAEGAERNDSPGSVPDWEPDWGYRTRCIHYPQGCECFPHPTAKDWYRELWDIINGKGSWNSNPWVWVIEFKRIVKAVSA